MNKLVQEASERSGVDFEETRSCLFLTSSFRISFATRAQAWAWFFFLGTVVVAAFMAKDVINVMLALPKLRGTKK